MINQHTNSGSARAAWAGVFALVIVAGTVAVAVPAWSQTPDQDEIAAMQADEAQGRGARVYRAELMPGPPGPREGMRGRMASARRGRAGFGGGRFDLASRALRQAEEIGLTDEQKVQIEATRDAHQRQRIEREASARLLRLDLTELLRDETSDLAVVEQKMNEAAALKVQEQMAALRYRRDVQGVLTAEQVEQLRERATEFMRRRAPEDRAPRTRRQQ
jgi:Spy/CpxP family protein refolding chaperone